jgi:phytoene/squalene synthetase
MPKKETHSTNDQLGEERRAAAIAQAEQASTRPSPGSAAGKYRAATLRRVKETIGGLTSLPQLRLEHDWDDESIGDLVDQYISTEGYPAPIARDLKEAGRRVISRYLDGDQNAAREYGRELAHGIGEALSRRADWNPDAVNEDADADVARVLEHVQRGT